MNLSRLKILLFFVSLQFTLNTVSGQIANSETYLSDIKNEFTKKWPNNRTINLVFHGHSVPTGYMRDGVVDRLSSYPFQTIKKINDYYPYSVINVITTSIGGEQAEQGSKRFKQDVLNYKPDVLFIDYALNDRGIGLEKAEKAWRIMIETALKNNIKVILLTPTPDLKEDIADPSSDLAKHAVQIKNLAKEYKVGLVDSYQFFRELSEKKELKAFMAQNNHINQKGHEFVADLIFRTYFK